jgi:hypothetical protein
MALSNDGEPRRSTVTHVRTRTEQMWAGWAPGELTRFIEEHAGTRAAPERAEASVPSVPSDAGNAPAGNSRGR